ncbi:hypothetical protein BH09VER1_BH09VER1_46730 [soil metagenome]
MNDIHNHLDEWIAAALLHDLTPNEQSAFDRHLEQNAEARALYHEAKAMSTLLENTLSPQRPSSNFENRMVSGFRETMEHSRQSWAELATFWLRRPVLYLPASALLLIGLVMLGASMTIEEDRRAEAKKDSQQIASASTGYVTEYGQMPVAATGEGSVNYGSPILGPQFKVFHRAGDGIVENKSDQIIFSTRRPTSSVSIYDGETVAQGGLAREDVQKISPPAAPTAPTTLTSGQQLNSSVANGQTIVTAGSMVSHGTVTQTNGVDLMTASTVTTKSGRLATAQTVREFRYPSEIAPTSPAVAPVTAGNRTASTAVSANAVDQLLFDNASQGQQFAVNKDLAKAEERPAGDSAQKQNWNYETSGEPAQPVADPTVIDNRKLVRNASLDLEVKNYDSALDSITAIAAGNSGYVATKNSARLSNGKMSGTIVLKVLPERLDAALLQIRGLGELKNQSLSTKDVTKEYFDTDARLRNARKMEDRLLDLLGTMKGKISELLQVEKELARVREQIEQMQGELKVYDSLVQYATITISLREKDLNEAAAYLLKENVNLSLFAGDVEKTYEAARREADSGKAQILQSRVVKEDSGRVTAVMDILIAPEDADGLISRIKGLGRVQNYNKQDERIAQDGSANLNTSKIERDKVRLSLSVLPDDESRKEIRLVVQTKKVEGAFEEAKSTASEQGATVVTSGLSVANGANGKNANLTVRTPGKNQTELLEAFKKLGLVSQFTVLRDDAGHSDPAEPVLITLALTNATQPVQVTRGAILTPQVEQQAAHLKQAAAVAQGETVTSTFERLPDGTQIANLVFRLPLDKYAAFFEEASRSGKMKDFTVQRQDRAEENPELATAEVVLRLYSQGPVVEESDGLMATLRHTLGQGAGALMWSVRMIGVALAFLAPWVLALAAAIWIARRIVRARKARASR